MKAYCVLGLFLLVFCSSYSQSVIDIKNFGGTRHEGPPATIVTSDGGSITAGSTRSNNGTVSGNHGLIDAWVVKLNSAGVIQWQRCIGGSSNEYATGVVETSNGEFIVSGYTQSNDGDFAGLYKGGWDIFVAKLSSSGGIVWKYCYGDAANQEAAAITKTPDGGYLVVGNTDETWTVYTRNYAIKINASGAIEWSYRNITFADAQSSYFTGVVPTADSGFICTGSASIIFAGQQGQLIKLSKQGQLRWGRAYGGIFNEYFDKIIPIDGSSILVTGSALNPSDHPLQPGHSGAWDYWVMKADTAGNVIWLKFYGGSKSDHANAAVKTTDGGFAVIGYTESNDSLVSGTRGGSDAWLVKLDPGGNLQWQRTYGADSYDNGSSIVAAGIDTLLVSGGSSWPGDHVHSNAGEGDLWFFKVLLHELPDLEVASASIPATISTGNNFTASFAIKNTGAGPADGVRTGFYLSADSILTPGLAGDTLIGTTGLTPVIAPGATSPVVNLTVLMPCTRPAGQYYLFFVADALRQWPEASENNNSYKVPFNLLLDKNNPEPIISASPADTVCVNSNVQLTVTTAAQCTGCTYQWNTGLETTPTIIVTSPNINSTSTYIVNVKNSCGQRSASKPIRYAAVPNLTVSASPGSICIGDSATLSASGASRFEWTGPNLERSTGSPVRAGSTATGNMSFTVKGSNGSTCTKSSGTTVQVTTCTVNASYTFTGSGNWTDSTNWLNNQVPPALLPDGTEVIIDHSPIGECIINRNITLAPGSKLTILPGRKLVVNGNVTKL